jgi:hypothetical protein
MVWLAACIALRLVGAVFFIFLQRWCKKCTILQPMGSEGRYLNKFPKPSSPIRIEETWTKGTPITFLSQLKFVFIAKINFLRYKTIGATKKFTKFPQKPNQSRETAPLKRTVPYSLDPDSHQAEFFEVNNGSAGGKLPYK